MGTRFSQYSEYCARVSQRHFGESRRHSTTGLSENIVVAGTGYQI